MKRFVFCILLFFVLKGFVFAQEYIAGVEKYEGLWVYQSNDTIFKLRLIRLTLPKEGSISDFVGGLYSIYVKGKEIANTISLESRADSIMSLDSLTMDDARRLASCFHIKANNHYLGDHKYDSAYMDFRLWYPEKFESGGAGIRAVLTQNTIKLLSPDKLEWKVVLRPGPDAYKYIGELESQGNPPAYAYPLPDYAILTKVLE